MTQHSTPNSNELLSTIEFEALQKSGELAGLIREIIGDGHNAPSDWQEACVHIHALQNMILAQAAARSYPYNFRLLGKRLSPRPTDESPADNDVAAK